MRSITKATALGVVIAGLWAVPAFAQPQIPQGWQPADGVPGNRIVNPGAEDLTPTWALNNVAVVAYGSSSAVPSTGFASDRNLGTNLFAATRGGGSMVQDVPVADVPGQPLLFGGVFGTLSTGPETTVMTVQFLDSRDAAVGSPASAQEQPVTPSSSGATTEHAFVGITEKVPPNVTVARVRIQISGADSDASSETVDGTYLTTQVGYGAVPVPDPTAPPISPPTPTAVLPPTAGTPPPQPSRPSPKPARGPSAKTVLSWSKPATTCKGKMRIAITVHAASVRTIQRVRVTTRHHAYYLRPTARRRGIAVGRSQRPATVSLLVSYRNGLSATNTLHYAACARGRHEA